MLKNTLLVITALFLWACNNPQIADGIAEDKSNAFTTYVKEKQAFKIAKDWSLTVSPDGQTFIASAISDESLFQDTAKVNFLFKMASDLQESTFKGNTFEIQIKLKNGRLLLPVKAPQNIIPQTEE